MVDIQWWSRFSFRMKRELMRMVHSTPFLLNVLVLTWTCKIGWIYINRERGTHVDDLSLLFLLTRHGRSSASIKFSARVSTSGKYYSCYFGASKGHNLCVRCREMCNRRALPIPSIIFPKKEFPLNRIERPWVFIFLVALLTYFHKPPLSDREICIISAICFAARIVNF